MDRARNKCGTSKSEPTRNKSEECCAPERESMSPEQSSDQVETGDYYNQSGLRQSIAALRSYEMSLLMSLRVSSTFISQAIQQNRRVQRESHHCRQTDDDDDEDQDQVLGDGLDLVDKIIETTSEDPSFRHYLNDLDDSVADTDKSVDEEVLMMVRQHTAFTLLRMNISLNWLQVFLGFHFQVYLAPAENFTLSWFFRLDKPGIDERNEKGRLFSESGDGMLCFEYHFDTHYFAKVFPGGRYTRGMIHVPGL